jgi:hypothetical protein
MNGKANILYDHRVELQKKLIVESMTLVNKRINEHELFFI